MGCPETGVSCLFAAVDARNCIKGIVKNVEDGTPALR